MKTDNPYLFIIIFKLPAKHIWYYQLCYFINTTTLQIHIRVLTILFKNLIYRNVILVTVLLHISFSDHTVDPMNDGKSLTQINTHAGYFNLCKKK